MKRIASGLVLPVVLLTAGCAAVGASEPGDAGTQSTGAPTWSEDELGTLPPVEPVDTAVAADLAGMPTPDIAAIRGDGAVVRVHDGHAVADGQPPARPGLVGLDRRTLVDAVTDGEATEVRWTDLFTGDTTGRSSILGAHLVPTATDASGRAVALVSEAGEQHDGTIAPGRTSSTIVVADRELGERYRITLDGNYHPEAFGTSGDPDLAPDTVYLLEYLPAEAPTHYRVRVLYTSSGEVGLPVNLRDKATEVDAEMAGISRTQVVSGHAGGLLFTLYRGVAGEGDRHGYAFVHTLGFAGGVWCLDIAPEMELDTQPGALVVAGDRLVVASANGTVGSYDIAAVLDPARPPVMDVVTQVLHPEGDPILAATDDRLWVAWANFVYELDPLTLEMLAPAPQQLTRPVTALAATEDGVLIASVEGTITWTDGTALKVMPDGDAIETNAEIVALFVDEAGTP